MELSEPSKSNVEVDIHGEQVEPTLSLSALLSNILGADEFDCNVYEEELRSNDECFQPDNVFIFPSTESCVQCYENTQAYGDNSYTNFKSPSEVGLPNSIIQYNGDDELRNEYVLNASVLDGYSKAHWNIPESFGTLSNDTSLWKPQFIERDSIQNIPYGDTLMPTYDYDQYHQGVLSSSDQVLVPWTPPEQFNYSHYPYSVCEPVSDSSGGRYISSTPRIKAKRMEHVVSIKIENGEISPPNAPVTPAMPPLEYQDYPSPGLHLAESGVVQNYAQNARIWGLKVEQWQTHQTTYRYYPSSCDTPTYWQGSWPPVEMPSSRETSPIPDGASLITSEELSPGGGSSSKAHANKRIDGKRCGVCGDRALGYNFNAITCESCKAFFRRNALKNKEYRCPFNDECEVTAVTRRFCQRCRLRKCFEVGMKKEWIMSEEDKNKKRKKIEENRLRKTGDLDCPSGEVPNDTTTPCINSEECLDQKTNFDCDEASISLADLPLPSKMSVPSNKPKAVVVGRVRVEENENKVRKLCSESDVHVQKAMMSEPLNSILNSTPRSEIGLTLSTYVTSPLILSDSFPQHQLELPEVHKVASSTTAESLVVGLLRTQSRGSAEDPNIAPRGLGCQGEDETLDPILIKKEQVEEQEVCNDFKFSEPASTVHVDQKTDFQNPFSYIATSSDPILCENPSVNFGSKGFDFSIREALNMIQPGCKDVRWSNVTSSGTSVMDSIMNTAISAEYSAFSLLINSHSSELNQAESIKITELLEASKGLNSPLCEEPNYKDLPNPSLINVINMTEIAIRRLIKMAKKISSFKTFCQEDQIALLKGGCAEMMILRSVSAYDPDKDVWKIQQDHERYKNIKLKILKAASGNVYEEHKRFILSFHSEWRQDTRIIALLAAIALFTPERPNVVHPQAVRHEQSSYLYLLKRYLECRYGGCVGKTNYLKLLEIISNLHILNEEHVKVFLEVNPQEVEPLLIEIFDLKQS